MKICDIISEGLWWELKGTTTLFHGTSSALLPRFKEHGILPPRQDFDAYVRELFSHYLESVDPAYLNDKIMEDLQDCLNGTIRYRVDRDDNFASVIYLSPSHDLAKRYAKSYARFGGEVSHELWSNIKRITGYTPTVIYPDAKPIIVEVEIPTEWMKLRTPLPIQDWIPHLKSLWDNNNSRFKKYFSEFGEFMDDVGDFEVRIEHPIPYSMIRNVHEDIGDPTDGEFGDKKSVF